MTRKYTPPLKIRPVPTTRKGILDFIDDLEAEKARSGPVMNAAIDAYIRELRGKLEKLPCSETKG